MDKGFSEDELADIMNEIESLEKEFSGPETVEEEIEPEHHEVLTTLTEMTIEEATHVESLESSYDEENEHQVETVQQFPKKEFVSKEESFHDEGSHSSMSFKVSGQMKLELGFDIAGTSVNIHVDEKEGLVVEMEGGVKFHIPVHTKTHLKKVS